MITGRKTHTNTLSYVTVMLPSLQNLAPTGLVSDCPRLVVPDADLYENNVINGVALPLMHAASLLRGTESSMPLPPKKLSVYMDALDAALVPGDAELRKNGAELRKNAKLREREATKREVFGDMVALNRGLAFLEVTGNVGLCTANQFFEDDKLVSASDELLTMIELIESLATQRGEEMTALEARIISFFATYGEAAPNPFPSMAHITTKSELLGLLFITGHRINEALHTLREVKAFVTYGLNETLEKQPVVELPLEEAAREDEGVSLVRRMINWLIEKPEETEEDVRLRELEEDIADADRNEASTQVRVDAETEAFHELMENAVRTAMAETWGGTDATAARGVSMKTMLRAPPTAAVLYSARAHGGEALRQCARRASVAGATAARLRAS